ncbi:MAG: hypothetical protein M3R27_07860, partial [Bacteroidota bacterium]|nr:hypothetical protein [Bacteroidota bacterium]
MMKIHFKFILSAVSLLISSVSFSQGLVETELSTNAVLVKKWNEIRSAGGLKVASVSDTLELGTLGILDDFSSDSPYPDSALWLDSSAYINRGYPYAPPTIGVATFDGISKTGYPYNFAASSTSSAVADLLTSKPINLEYTISPFDSIYFSFFYQPQGRGNAPELGDSLVVQFRAAGVSSTWKNVWAKRGSTLNLSDTLR